MPFSDYLPKLVPGWLQRTRWAQYLSAFASTLDGVVAAAKAAVKMRFLSSATPSDALTAIGGERQLERASPNANGIGVPETDAQYEARLEVAWSSWAKAATADGILQALWDLGYHTAQLNIRNGFSYSLDGSRHLVITPLLPGSWETGADGRYSDFDLIFTSPPTPATGAPSDWSVAIPSAISDEVAAIKRILIRWKPAWTTCKRIVVFTGGNHWGWPPPPSELHWGDSGLTWGGGTISRILLGI